MAKKNRLPVAAPSNSVGTYKPTKEDQDRERRYRAEDALRTVQRYEEIKKDKSLIGDVKKLIKEQTKLANKMCD